MNKIKQHSFKAWAIVNDETGRVMITNHSFGKPRMEAPEIWMTKRAAKCHSNSDERVIQVVVTEA